VHAGPTPVPAPLLGGATAPVVGATPNQALELTATPTLAPAPAAAPTTTAQPTATSPTAPQVGTPSPAVPSLRVSPGARPQTAGAGGIASIERSVDRETGVSSTTIEGRLLPTLAQRADLEKLLGPAIPGTDRAHLWGRIFGDEAAAGTLYAPSGFNRGVQLTLEKALQELQTEASAAGGDVWLRAANRSYPRSVMNGRALAEVEYEISVRLPNGQISRTVRIAFTDISTPATPTTPNRPGYTISAPFEGSSP
jgi:hypothetical protein